MPIRKFSSREKALVTITVAFVLFAAVVYFILSPILGRWASLDSEIASKKNVFLKNTRILAKYARMKETRADVTQTARATKSDDEEVVNLISSTESLAKENGCFIVNIKPMGLRSEEVSKEALIELIIRGSVEQLAKFFYDLEHLESQLIRVRRFNLSPGSDRAGELEAALTVAKIMLG